MSADHSLKQQKVIATTTDITDTEDTPDGWYSYYYDYESLRAYGWLPSPTPELTTCDEAKLDKRYPLVNALDFFIGTDFTYEGTATLAGVCFIIHIVNIVNYDYDYDVFIDTCLCVQLVN